MSTFAGVSAVIRDTGAVWATAILTADRPIALVTLSKAAAPVEDDETRNNLSSIEALLTQAK
jgi:hypothetical protein